MHVGDTLFRAPDQQLTVEHAGRSKRLCDIREARRNVVPRPAVEPRLAAGVHQLDPDPVPFPLRRIFLERNPGVVERMGQHERAKHRHVRRRRLFGAAFSPVEQLRERRPEPVPDLFNRFHLEAERLGKRLLREPRIDADAQLAERELQQGIAAGCIEMVEHRGKDPRRIQARRRA